MEGIGVFEVFPAIAINQEGSNEPDKQSQRYYNGHDEVADFIAQVHEVRSDVKGFGQRQDGNQTFDHQNSCMAAMTQFENSQTAQQFDDGNHRKNDGYFPYRFFKRAIVVVLYKRNFR